MHGADQLINTLLTRNHLRPLSEKSRSAVSDRALRERGGLRYPFDKLRTGTTPAEDSDQWPYEMGDDAPPPPTTTSRKPGLPLR